MVKFESKEFILDCKRSDVIVVELNCQNIVYNNKTTRRIRSEFPEYFKWISDLFLSGKLKPGLCFIRNIRGYIICGIVNQYNRSDDVQTIENFNEIAVLSMVKQLGFSRKYVSDFFSGWAAITKCVMRNNLTWSVFLE